INGVVSKDHLYIFVSAPPTMAPSEIMRRIKGRTASKLFSEFPAIKKRYWGNFQQNLQKESRQNIRPNLKVLNKPTPNKGVPLKKTIPRANSLPIEQDILSIKKNLSTNGISSTEPSRREPNHLKKIITFFLIIVVLGFAMQQLVPVLIKGTESVTSEVAAFFKNDASSFVKRLAAIKSKLDSSSSTNPTKASKSSLVLSKNEIKSILQQNNLLNLTEDKFTVNDNVTAPNINRNLTITTSLDMRLQSFLLEQIDSLMMLNRGKPEIIAMVVMEPHTGKILGMAGFDNHSPYTNPCTQGEYPAASLFKMVTASAAVETCGYSPATTMYFSGGKYTLYKRQLSEDINTKFLNKVTLAEAFAQSINPVFGKLGSIILGKDILEKYASSFGFNQEVDSEINFRPATFTITNDNTYQWAEVACGFNTTTTISPIFGAMIASTMLNSGKTPVPSIVECVKDEKGVMLYKRKSEILNDAVKPETAKAMMQMMNGTIITGTARKSFRGVDKDNVLSRLIMGGKTGSLSSYDNRVRFDWFSGFCSDTQDRQQIVVSVLVGHGKYIGTKASIYGRLIFKEYFNNYFAINSQQLNNG
ncbi:MAG: transposase, partial [Desulfamplus sp.]|nr:transposase [Desulfamplus sp.]